MRKNPWLACALVICLMDAASAQGLRPPLPSLPLEAKTSAPALQAWQIRRLSFANIVKGVKTGDPSAQKAFDGVLTEFDTTRLARTPIEELEIIGVYYLPKEGPLTALPIIVAIEILGWYDALRFTSESGRAEISQNEGFFKKPFVIAGSNSAAQFVELSKEHLDQVRAAINQGVAIAEKVQDQHVYDSHWPTAYGLEHTICVQGGDCSPPAPMSESEWPFALRSAEERVSKYFGVTDVKAH